MSRSKPPPAWGGGAGSRLASTAAAAKLQTVRGKGQARSASSTGFRAEEAERASSTSDASWGFAACGEATEEENCLAATPGGSPTNLVTPSKGEPRAGAGSVKALEGSFAESSPSSAGSPPAPTSAAAATALSPDASAKLAELASKLGAAARGGGTLQLGVTQTWEEAFLAGVAVGQQMPALQRQRSFAFSRLLLSVAAPAALLMLAGSAALLAGWGQGQAATVFFT